MRPFPATSPVPAASSLPASPPAPRPPLPARRTAPMPAAARRRSAFTLIEMLIAVTLVLLMMGLFAQIFGLAAETVSTRKGMASNDQKSRLLADRIKKDLDARTMDVVYPFAGAQLTYDLNRVNNADPATPVTGWRPKQAFDEVEGQYVFEDAALSRPLWEARPARVPDDPARQGYWSFSENDPDDDGDDVLSFTTDRRKRSYRGDADFSPARGRAAVLYPFGALGGSVPLADQPATDSYVAVGVGAKASFEESPLANPGHPNAGVAAAANAVLGAVAAGGGRAPMRPSRCSCGTGTSSASGG